ncbi:exodeoxyribonuclease V subunit alpha [Aliiglaciecola sp.]|nr:exodeoxyribonuclease V subunit alpha [Aliiglaciecola sp.]
MVVEHSQGMPSATMEIADLFGFSSIDKAFMQFVFQQEPCHKASLSLLAGWVSYRLNQQDTCVELAEMSAKLIHTLGFSGVDDMLEKVTQASCFCTPSATPTPLVLDKNSLYLQRYYYYESELAKEITARLQITNNQDVSSFKPLIGGLFDLSNQPSGSIDWQCVAVCIAAMGQFSLITGGPGTGKTTTVAKLLAVLNGVASDSGQKLTIKLVAPTGKAAARLTESILAAKQQLPAQYQAGLELQCTTIHRLLGSLPNRIDFKHHKDNQLHLDVLIIDEASMVDLPLMYKTISAVPRHARIVLLGDHNQLSSVETGSVLSDIYYAAKKGKLSCDYSDTLVDSVEKMSGYKVASNHTVPPQHISNSLVQLVKSYRFSVSGGIGQLANAVIQGDVNGAHDVFNRGAQTLHTDKPQGSVDWFQNQTGKDLAETYVTGLSTYFKAVQAGNIKEAFKQLSRQQILCAFKTGPWGTLSLNMLVEKELVKRELINLESSAYSGRPIMLSKNDHSLGLFNGDIGIIMPDPDAPELTKAWFKMADNQLKGILITRLPEYTTVYAMTIHKSQGSEFDHVSLCLPQDNSPLGSTLISRELLYTGLTRARSTFDLYADETSLNQCLNRVCKRSSALYQRLL